MRNRKCGNNSRMQDDRSVVGGVMVHSDACLFGVAQINIASSAGPSIAKC